MSNVGEQIKYRISDLAIQSGAVDVGFTHIRKVQPAILFAFPFPDRWFAKVPLSVARSVSNDYLQNRKIMDQTAGFLASEGYTAEYKTILSVFGDFRPLAVAAGLGQWGKNGLVVNKLHGSALLFAALFTNAPLEGEGNSPTEAESLCHDCNRCLTACPAKAFAGNRFHLQRCLPRALMGCAECVRVCKERIIH